MGHKLALKNRKITKCGLEECCPIQDEAFAELEELRCKADKYEQILKIHNLLDEEPSKISILERIFSIDNIDSFFIYACYIGGLASILFGLLSNSIHFTIIGILALILVRTHTEGLKDEQ